MFRSQGLERYGEVADKFDPHLHDAMFEFEDPAQEPGTLGQVRKKNNPGSIDLQQLVIVTGILLP